MKIIFDVSDSKTTESVGTVVVEGNWGDLAFRNHVYRLLKFYEDTTLTTEEIHRLQGKVRE